MVEIPVNFIDEITSAVSTVADELVGFVDGCDFTCPVGCGRLALGCNKAAQLDGGCLRCCGGNVA